MVNKKRLMYPVFLLILLIVGFYLTINVDGFGYATRNPLYTYINITGERNNTNLGTCQNDQTFDSSSRCNALYVDLANWTRGGNRELVAIQININDTIYPFTTNNITRINVTLPSGFTFPSPVFGGNNNTFFGFNANTINNTWAAVHNTSGGLHVSYFNTSYIIMSPNTSLLDTITLYFNATAINGTESVQNWTISLYNSTHGSESAFNVTIDSGLGLLTGIDGLPPRMISMNITDGTHTITSGYTTSSALSNSSAVNISIVVEDYNVDRVILIYNNTGGVVNLTGVRLGLYDNVSRAGTSQGDLSGANFTNGNITENGAITRSRKANVTTLLGRSSLTNATAHRYEFKFGLPDWSISSSSGTFSWAFVVYDLYNQTEIINNSNSNFQVTNDPSVPTASITEPSTLSIRTTNSVTYKCTCGDSQSSIKTCTTTLTKPSGAATSKTGSATDLIFTGDDTNEAGEYTVTCKAVNYVDLSTTVTATNKLLVSTASSSSTGGTSGGSSGGEATQVISEEVTAGTTKDIGTFTETQITQISEQGSVSFKVGTETHTAKVLTVGTDSVTIEVSSTPKQVTLTIGETKDVDTNDDGTDDISISLNAITNGKADITFKNLATSGGTEEISTTTTITQPPVVTGTEPTSKAWIWWTLIAVIIIVIVVLLLRKKK